MRILAACAALLALVALLSSCSSIPEQMAGTYLPKAASTRSEWVTITSDGAMTWNYSSKNPHVEHFVGLISTTNKRPETAQLTFVSTSPFNGTQLSFSPDCSKLTVDWRVRPMARDRKRSTTFVKKPAAP